MEEKTEQERLEEIITERIDIYSYKFPRKKVYIGFTIVGLELRHRDYAKYRYSPLYNYIKKYPYIKPKIEVSVLNKSLKEIYEIEKNLIQEYINKEYEILNNNLSVLGIT